MLIAVFCFPFGDRVNIEQHIGSIRPFYANAAAVPCVFLSVCHKSLFYQNSRKDRAGFRAELSFELSAQVKAHVVLNCTNGVSPNHLLVIVASDRPRTTLSSCAH